MSAYFKKEKTDDFEQRHLLKKYYVTVKLVSVVAMLRLPTGSRLKNRIEFMNNKKKKKNDYLCLF